MNPYPRTWIEVNLPNLAHNISLVRGRFTNPNTRVALVAKADAYGHGLAPVARYALQHGVDWIAVATVQEAITLRDAGIASPIIVISPILPIEADQAVFYDIRVLIERVEMAQELGRAAQAQGTTAIVHLEADTGLGRFGCEPEQAPEVANAIRAVPGVRLEGFVTHFVDSGFDRSRTEQQIRMFKQIVTECSNKGVEFEIYHAANSAGATLYDETQNDLVRIGIAAYGVDPYGMFDGNARPIMTWKTRVTSLRTRPKGYTVSYSATKTLDRETRIATLGVGYGDGYPRALSNIGVVEIHGQQAPVLGLVCMDQMLVDVTDIPEAQIGDDALLIGGSITVELLAKLINTNVHEIITRIMSRVPRRYLYETQ